MQQPGWINHKEKCSRAFIKSREGRRKGRAEMINTISIHINENYKGKGWEELVGTFSLIDPEREKRETMATVSVSPSLSILFVRQEVIREARTHIHTQNIFWMMLPGNICQPPSSQKKHFCGFIFCFNMQFDASILSEPSLLHEFI